ncbi:hypothetical protein NECAME_18136 [Necator americanus]|uniref:Uncharacterized protein n=1 Tax=Necator americanus TaxID=51031 RepID=W2TCN6_NECAM|nr:hypothetical protein NECAME_18136 [Necator americanus]ETN79359.1 hypothetical protein NECAME_18136 [Necator americanus]
MGFPKGSDFKDWRDRELESIKSTMELYGLQFEEGTGRQEHMSIPVYKEVMTQKAENERQKEENEVGRERIQEKEKFLDRSYMRYQEDRKKLNEKEDRLKDLCNRVDLMKDWNTLVYRENEPFRSDAILKEFEDCKVERKISRFRSDTEIVYEIPEPRFRGHADRTGNRLHKAEKIAEESRTMIRTGSLDNAYALRQQLQRTQNALIDEQMRQREEEENWKSKIGSLQAQIRALSAENQSLKANTPDIEKIRSEAFKSGVREGLDQVKGQMAGSKRRIEELKEENNALKSALKKVVKYIAKKVPQVLSDMYESFQQRFAVTRSEAGYLSRAKESAEMEIEQETREANKNWMHDRLYRPSDFGRMPDRSDRSKEYDEYSL